MPNLKDTDVPGSSVTARANSPAGERAVSLVVSPTRSRPSHSTVTFSKTIPVVAAAETILTRPRTFRPEYTTHLASCLSSTSPFKSHEDGLGRASSSDPTLALVDVDANARMGRSADPAYASISSLTPRESSDMATEGRDARATVSTCRRASVSTARPPRPRARARHLEPERTSARCFAVRDRARGGRRRAPGRTTRNERRAPRRRVI